MGYFSNGTEGQMFEAAWCQFCVNCRTRGEDDAEPWCPVMMVHLLYNYDQLPNNRKDTEGEGKIRAKLESALTTLIDSSLDDNGAPTHKCHMYHPESAARELERQGQTRIPGT